MISSPEFSTKQLRVAMLAPISWRVPPRHYGPWEQFVSLLTEGLVARGVDVTLFATADSVTEARLVGTAPTGYSEDSGLDPKVWEGLHISAVFERAEEFDVIHNSFDYLPLTYSGLVDTPVVTTIHGFSSAGNVAAFAPYSQRRSYVAARAARRAAGGGPAFCFPAKPARQRHAQEPDFHVVIGRIPGKPHLQHPEPTSRMHKTVHARRFAPPRHPKGAISQIPPYLSGCINHLTPIR